MVLFSYLLFKFITVLDYAVSSQIKLAVWRDAGSILECVWLATAFSSGLARVNFS